MNIYILSLKTCLPTLFYKVFLQLLQLTANIPYKKLLALYLQRVELFELTCLKTLHQVLLLNAFAATSYKYVQINLDT